MSPICKQINSFYSFSSSALSINILPFPSDRDCCEEAMSGFFSIIGTLQNYTYLWHYLQWEMGKRASCSVLFTGVTIKNLQDFILGDCEGVAVTY